MLKKKINVGISLLSTEWEKEKGEQEGLIC